MDNPKALTDQKSRWVGLMADATSDPFAIAELNTPYPATPDVLVLPDGQIYIVGASGGGGGPSLVIDGHPVGDFYVRASTASVVAGAKFIELVKPDAIKPIK